MDKELLSLLGKEEEPVDEKKTKAVGSDKIDKDIFAAMLTADGEDGNFSSPKEPEIPEGDKPTVSIKPGEVKEQLGKYEDEFMENVMKKPDKFYVETSRGTMSIKDAVMAGWDPKTGEFNDADSFNTMKEQELAKLSDNDRAAVEAIMNPNNAGFAAADAEGLGLDPDSPMIAQPPQALTPDAMPAQEQAPQGEAPAGQIDPAILQKMIGGSI